MHHLDYSFLFASSQENYLCDEVYLCRYSNIYVTAPSPENLKTLFEFVCKGFNVLEYKVHLKFL